MLFFKCDNGLLPLKSWFQNAGVKHVGGRGKEGGEIREI